MQGANIAGTALSSRTPFLPLWLVSTSVDDSFESLLWGQLFKIVVYLFHELYPVLKSRTYGAKVRGCPEPHVLGPVYNTPKLGAKRGVTDGGRHSPVPGEDTKEHSN